MDQTPQMKINGPSTDIDCRSAVDMRRGELLQHRAWTIEPRAKEDYRGTERCIRGWKTQGRACIKRTGFSAFCRDRVRP